MPLRPPATPPLRALVVLLVLTALLIGPSSAIADTPKGKDASTKTEPKPKPKKPPKQKPLYWGAWIGDQLTGTGAPWDMGAVTKFEELVGKGLSVVEFSQPFADCGYTPCIFTRFPRPQMDAIRAYGAIPFYSWGSQSIPAAGPEQPDFQLADVNAGTYDDYIRRFAEEVRDWGHPFFLRFNWEPNGEWFTWDEGVNGNKPGEFVSSWRRVHDIFGTVGASNVTWVWCPYADKAERYGPLKRFYPGPSYVDWTCLDGYNWSKAPTHTRPWASFDKIFWPNYKTIVKQIAPKKPMILGEMGTNGIGNRKATWFSKMFSLLRTKYPRVRGLVYFNQHAQGITWPIETSPASINAFSLGIHSGPYRPNIFSGLAESPIRPPS
ncbi:MAG TPA: glycosyl hydrolase [Solirubrobacterales bacterium]|nr:glycosyl hydrolase [Solirubrobacterales bacterium]